MADGGTDIWKGLVGTDHLKTAEEAFKLIESETGRPFKFKVSGFRMLVLLQVRQERTAGSIIIPAASRENDPRRARCAMVLQQGPECYTGVDQFGNQKFPNGPYCAVSDWIMFDRYDATSSLFKYRGKFAMGITVDERISGVVDEPSDVVAIRMEDLY